MVKQKIIDILFKLPTYPSSWCFRDLEYIPNGLQFNVINSLNKTKTIRITQDQDNTFDVEILNSFYNKEYTIYNVKDFDLVEEIDDYVNIPVDQDSF